MCKPQTVCKITQGPFAFHMEKFPSLQYFYTHAVTGVTDNYQVCWLLRFFLGKLKLKGKGSPCHSIGVEVLPIQVKVFIQAVKSYGAGVLQISLYCCETLKQCD